MSEGFRAACCSLLLLSGGAFGQFGTGQPLPSSGNNVKLLAADMDADGDIDLFGVFHGDKLKWFANTDGQGTFGQAQLIVDLDGGCTLVELADVDGDRDPDLLIVGDDPDEVMVFLNNGDGTFTEEDEIDLGGHPEALTVADINGDGHPDLLVTMGFEQGPGVGILLGSAEGFGPLIPHAGLHRGTPSPSLLVGDVDLVGGLDLVLNAANDTLVVARNVAGDASEWLVEALNIPGGELGYPYRRPQLLDIDNDGDLDIGEVRGSAVHWLRNGLDEGGVLSFEENVIEPWTSSGEGAFGRSICSAGACLVYVPNNPVLPVRWSSYLPLLDDLAYSNDVPALPRGRRPLLADFDGDGRDDLVMEVDHQLVWYKGTVTRDDSALELPLIDTLCLAGAPVALPEVTPTGGRWYGQQISNGLLFRTNLPGTMDLPAVHAVYPEGGCPLAEATHIRVIQGPRITTTVPPVICSADAPIVMGSEPSNVAWYGLDGGNVLDPTVWSGGYVVCEYTDATGQMCSDLEGPVLRWNSLPAQLAEVPTLCTTDAIAEIRVVAAPPSNVVWEGPVLNATASGAQFDPSIGPGIYTVIINAEAFGPNQCRNSDTIQVVVGEAPVISFAPTAIYCLNGGPIELHGAEPTGGTWSGDGVDAGHLDPQAVGEGTHPVSYFAVSDEGCSAQASTSITLAREATVTSTAADLLLCPGEAAIRFDAEPAGGSWNGPVDEEGLFLAEGLEPAEYQLTYVYMDPQGCILPHEPVFVTIGTATEVGITAPDRICLDAPSFELTGSAAGVWSGSVTGEGSGITIDPSVLGVGIWPVTLTVSPSDACPSEATIDLIVDVCAGISERLEDQLTAAPMPFTERTTVRFGELRVERVDVMDASGKRLIAQRFGGSHPTQLEVDLSSFADGVYLLHATGEKGTARLRLVKAH